MTTAPNGPPDVPDPLACPPASLKVLVRHGDPRVRRLGLIRLAERLGAGLDGDRAELPGFADALPDVTGGGPPLDDPEAALALARLHLRLRAHVRRGPRWREAADGLPVRVRIAWLSAEIAARPGAVRDEPAGEPLYQAVHALGADDVDDPEVLARELMDRPDPALRAEALRIVREAVHAALLAPSRARELVTAIAAVPDALGAAGALRELADPWAALAPLPEARLRALADSGAEDAATGAALVEAAVEVAGRHGHPDLLRDMAADPGRPPALRQRALELLGDLADRDDVGELLGIAGADPLLLARPAVRCLGGMHQRGHFATGADVPAVVALALADHSVPADDVATVLFTCRHELLRELTAGGGADPRRLELLVAMAAQGAEGLPVGDAVTGLLPDAADPAPVLRAIRALRHTAAEDAVIAVLPRSPAAALDALEAVGGTGTVTALRAGLGLDGGTAGDVAPWLRPVRHRALELLWHLTEDPGERHSIMARLDPRDLPAGIAADLGGPDGRELALLRAGLDPADPALALRRLARDGDAGTLPAIADLLLRVASDLAASWAPDALDRPADPAAPGGPGGPGGPAGEPVVPDEVAAAVRGLGGRLHARGRIRPRCLLDAANARDAGEALLTDMVLDLLDRPALTPAEQMILLGVLLQCPPGGIRPRVHRLLRHRDPHVRKRVIALLARDAEGADARALSASLIVLTTARDVQTVRQALLALGHARAGWAAAAVAACLDHPNMNVKKTAATALARAGAPVAVPRLLHWLGAHDNPGLRAALLDALRTILGDACTATVLAAADRAPDGRTRSLLLQALDGALPARSVGALADQGSPAGTALLALVAEGRVRLGSGTVTELDGRMAAHGISPPAPGKPSPAAEFRYLKRHGWNGAIARRLAEQVEEREARPLLGKPFEKLRPMLARWLDLAGEDPARSVPVVRFTLRLCPPPWTGGELEAFARSARLLVAALPDVDGPHRDRLLAVLDDAVPRLPAPEALEIAARLRALPPVGPSTLRLLRRCGAVLTRDDLEHALAAARTASTVRAVLQEAFGPGDPGAGTAPDPRWRESLEAAVRSPDAVRAFRAADGREIGSRERLAALIGAFPAAGSDVRGALLDWMVELQPIGAPEWTLAEAVPPARAARPGDLDQPRSAALRGRLLAMLDDPAQARRDTAARALLNWPEPDIRHAVLGAFLRGRVDLTLTPGLARALAPEDAETGDDAVAERAARVAAHLDPPELRPFLPALLRRWEHASGPGARAAAAHALRQADPDTLAGFLSDRLDAGAWGLLDLITGVPLLRTAALARTRERLRGEGRGALADRLVLVDGPLRHPGAAHQDAATLAALRTRVRDPRAAARAQRPSREELLRLARTGGTEQIRRALSLLAEGAGGADTEFEDVLAASLGHPEPRVRLHAHRISRKVLDRDAHLALTVPLLDDRQPDIVCSAVRTLVHAGWTPAVPALVGLLTHARPAVRRAAADGLVRLGAPAVPALKHAAGRARPDRRPLYTRLLDEITAATSATAKS